jgi:alpha-galactosidase
MKHFGYYTTESSEHNAEYTPYWISPNHPELISSYGIPLDEYPRRCESQIKEWTEQREKLLAQKNLEHTGSKEYAGSIIQARITDQHVVIHGNIRNDGFITNLPQEAIVEVPCLIDRYGIHGVHVGALPVQCAALNRTNINTQLLTIEAALTNRMEYVYQAALLDPHTSAVLSIDSIIRLCDELLEAHAQWLPEYTR